MLLKRPMEREAGVLLYSYIEYEHGMQLLR
jgi:hypothetical protein